VKNTNKKTAFTTEGTENTEEYYAERKERKAGRPGPPDPAALATSYDRRILILLRWPPFGQIIETINKSYH
jgi:hypothetical protein